MNHRNESDEIRTKVLTENTAQGVLNHLKALASNRARMITRWIWELLQNAHDTLATFVSIESGQREVIFQHNGTEFKMEEIAHLIYHGSTKVEDEETIGQYGSGFLTTHLLSPIIEVSGQLDDGQSFKFPLKREIGSVRELSDSMEHAWKAFNNSLTGASSSNGSTTQFQYPGEEAASAAKDGLADLKQCAPFVVVFNETFSRINIKSPDGTMNFEVVKRASLPQDGLQVITVSENGSQKAYLLAEGAKASVAVPLEPTDDGGRAVLPIDNTPRLFLGFPLIGTESFSFPAVINSRVFTPTEDRDGVYLGQSDDEANLENQAAMEQACELLLRLIRFAASSGWSNTYALANVPAIRKQNWLNSCKLRESLKEQLIERIRQIPAVLCELGAISPKESVLPLAETDTGVENLWDLLDGLKEFRQKLPRLNEAVGWCDAVKSWAKVHGCPEADLNEAFDGRKLALRVEEETKITGEEYGRLENLQKLLRENVRAIEWLDQLYQFLKDNRLDDAIRTQSIIPDQGGFLDELSNLHRDQGIAEELKDIAELLNWNIRRELRDKRLPSLADEGGAGDWDSDHVVQQLIAKLQKRSEENPDSKFAQASVDLFAWIVGQENLNLLRGFPVFAKESGVDGLAVAYLPIAAQDSDRPLAPVLAWSEDLRPFEDLFPQNCILADAFFEAVPALDTWRILDEQGFVRTNIVITHNVNFQKFFPDSPLPEGVHRTSDRVLVTDVVSRTEIMSRVRDSQSRARLFWRFLTEWLAKEDLQALESKKAECECGKTHRYYPAAWIEPLRENNWVRLGNEVRDYATAQSLANLLRDSGWEPSSLNENPAAVRLLEAINVTRFNLTREFVAGDPETRTELDNAFTDILVVAGGNVGHLSRAREYIEDLQNDKGLPDILKKRREDLEMVQKNQHLGQCVEELVKESLESEGFTVTRTGTGSDYEIKLAQGSQSWLVEVKATTGDQEVRMTTTQARTAVAKGSRFLLCVVPVESGDPEPELDEVRDKMRFVENIGSHVADLCKNLDELEELRDEITASGSSGVQLVVEAGTARVRVASSVWDKGFRLEDLSEKLS